MLDVVCSGEPDEQEVEEIHLVLWEGFAGEDLEEVAEVVGPIIDDQNEVHPETEEKGTHE